MKLMLRTEKPQLPLQLEEAAGVQETLVQTFGNLQVLCKRSQEQGEQEAGAQIYIRKEHMLDMYLLYFRVPTAQSENGAQAMKICMCIEHLNC